MPKKKPVEFNEREATMIQKWIAGGMKSIKQAAIDAGYPKEGAQLQGGRVLKKLSNAEKLQKELRKRRIGFPRIAEKLDQLMEAEHPQFVGRPDNYIQHKTVMDVVKIMDGLPAQKVDINQNQRTEIIISADIVHRAQAFEEKEKPRVLDAEIEQSFRD